MKYYKVMQNRSVIDLLHFDEKRGPRYIKYQLKHGIPLLCSEREAEAFISDNEKIYTTGDLLPLPSDDLYPMVSLEEISEVEYNYILDKNFKTSEQIRQELLLDLLERGGL